LGGAIKGCCLPSLRGCSFTGNGNALYLSGTSYPAFNGEYVIATYGTLTGTFNNIDVSQLGLWNTTKGVGWDINYGSGTNDVIKLTIMAGTVIPEPATLGLLAMGLAGAIVRRRKM